MKKEIPSLILYLNSFKNFKKEDRLRTSIEMEEIFPLDDHPNIIRIRTEKLNRLQLLKTKPFTQFIKTAPTLFKSPLDICAFWN